MLRKTLSRFAVWPAVAACALALGGPVRAQIQIPPARPAAPAAPAAAPPGDMAALAVEAQGWLSDLIKIDTSNPPGNESATAKYIAAVLQKENIPSEVIEFAPGRSYVIAHLQAGPLPNPSRALLLVAHQDVVGVDKTKWSVDPFSATVKDGYLYGRGAIDDKGMLAANLAAFVQLKRSGTRLNRDVTFLADDDEEQGGSASIKPFMDKYWDKVACGFALNEGGRVMLDDGKVQYVGIQASEKVFYNITVTATGTSGHASVPLPNNAVTHLSAAIEKIGAMQTPAQMITITRRYFEGLAQFEDEDTAKWMRALETTDRFELAVIRLGEMSPVWGAMLRDTVAPTELKAGIRANVVPSEAWANLNVRILPGNSISSILALLQKTVNDPAIRFQVEPDSGTAAPESSLENELYQTIARAAGEQFPGVSVVPMLSTGATDSAPLRLHNVQSYGLLPFPLSEADDLRMHADDERIPVSSIRTGVEFLYRTVYEFVSAR